MSALAEALVAAQRASLTALGKAYVAGTIEAEDVTAKLDAIGLRDAVDGAQWLAALDVIREHGATAPTAPAGSTPRPDEPATEAQWKRIRRDCETRNVAAPDGPLTKQQASNVIEQIASGTYDPAAWSVPF